jgi:hypothetical protein
MYNQPPQQQGRVANANTLPAYAMGAYSQVQNPVPMQHYQQLQPQSQQQSKASAVLYYSNYCKICNDLIRMIASRNLKSFFALVCVDSDRSKVPAFVKSVPLAYISARATGGAPQLLIEGALLEYIERCAAARPTVHSPGSITTADASPSEIGTVHTSGGSYSFLDGEEKPEDGMFLYELNENNVDFRINNTIDEMSMSRQQQPQQQQDMPSFLVPVETRINSSSGNMDLSSIDVLRRADEDKWKQMQRPA